MFYKEKYKKALEEINFMKEMYDKNARSDNTNLKIKMLDLRRENEELKFKVNQKQDLGEVISQIRKLYLSNFDKDLHKQYIELVKLYNRIGE